MLENLVFIWRVKRNLLVGGHYNLAQGHRDTLTRHCHSVVQILHEDIPPSCY